MPNTLWTIPIQATGQMARAIAAYGGIPIELAPYNHYVDNHKPEFTSKFPLAKIPAFEGDDGFKMVEGVPIARYVASLSPKTAVLLGKTSREAAIIDQWIHITETEFAANMFLVYQLLNGSISPYYQPLKDTFHERCVRSLRLLDSHIKDRTYFVGDDLTFADIVISALVRFAATVNIDAPLRAELPHIMRHAEYIAKLPQFAGAGIWDDIKYVEKGLEFVENK